MKRNVFTKSMVLVLAVLLCTRLFAQVDGKQLVKELFIPAKVYRIPENNNYHSDTSEYNFTRSVQGDNIAIFWHKEFGQDPTTNPVETKRFDPNEALRELERFYN